MVTKLGAAWDGAVVRNWLNSRVVAARADQVMAERRGRTGHDDCDMAAAEEMVCTLLRDDEAVDGQRAFAAALKALADRDQHVWRGVYDDDRFDRHVRAYVRKLAGMARANKGFDNVRHHQ